VRENVPERRKRLEDEILSSALRKVPDNREARIGIP
jgi:hypothetical protein